MPPRPDLPPGVELRAPALAGADAILSRPALELVARLTRAFRERRDRLLDARREVQERLDAGWLPDFLPETEDLRASEWTVAAPPADLRDRRVEITGPVERKMVINALNSGANVFMADFEDSTAPTWANVVEGQLHLRDAVRREIDFEHPATGKRYALAERTATLVVRPRGWHLDEAHLLVDGRPAPGGLVDFALYFSHNARELLARGSGPYFYLPKLEHFREAELWNDVFVEAQRALGIPRGTIRATVLIETILAAFQMDEILHALREHSSGLNCGRWDYIFSFIKRFRERPDFVLPDRWRVTMETHFLRSYSLLLIRTCHGRGAHAMGGMAAQIPVKGDEQRNREALAKVAADKRREAGDGHDGTWVAHPGLVAVARAEFDRVLQGPHQIGRLRDDVHITAADLLRVPSGPITEEGVRRNVAIGARYLAAWLGGTGCVPLHDLMEDAATAEISRAQLWQWRRHRARLDDGRVLDDALLARLLDDELAPLRASGSETDAEAAALFERLATADALEEFLTLPAYDRLLTLEDTRCTP